MKSKIQVVVISLSISLFILMLFSFTQSATDSTKKVEYYELSTPLGTIISSTLSFNQFVKVTEDKRTYNPKRSKWAPADGRIVSDSDYHKLTSKSVAPDLRGQFIRGKNLFLNDGMQASVYTNGKDAGDREDKNLYSYQTDKVGEHVHPYKVFWEDAKGGNASRGSNANGTGKSEPNTKGNINSGEETRPKNMNVYYYIRINK